VILLVALLALDPAREAEARAVLQGVLEGAAGEVTLRLFETRAEMERAVRRADRHAPIDFVALYHYGSRTIFACDGPLLLGAIAHEAQHAKGALADAAYRRRPYWRIEGEADRDAVLFLRGKPWPGAGAWEFWLESRVARARDGGLFASDDLFRRARPNGLPPDQRATWYAQAYRTARGGEDPALDWVLHEGVAWPQPDGFRLVPEPRGAVILVRRSPGSLRLRVEGRLSILFDFVDSDNHGEIEFLRGGGVRAAWNVGGVRAREATHPAPRDARLLEFDRGTLRADGTVVLHVQTRGGRVGVAARGAAAGLSLRP